ncbi:MAG TPA: hypothetical protein VLK33_16445, partial [Terriglobales bacterium]|nr:hypothetical protein [Terriglobales bacterium]
VITLLVLNLHLVAQTGTQQTPPSPKPAEDYSGAYTFLQDGELLQLNIEDEGKVSGFVQRLGDTETDRGMFLDHFFKEAKLEGKNLTFNTKTVHGVSYEFKGTIERGDGKKPGDEAYYVLKGTLIQSNIDSQQRSTTKTRDVVFKAFPQNLDGPPEKK